MIWGFSPEKSKKAFLNFKIDISHNKDWLTKHLIMGHTWLDHETSIKETVQEVVGSYFNYCILMTDKDIGHIKMSIEMLSYLVLC